MKCPKCGYNDDKLRINIFGGGSAGHRHARMLGARGHICTIIDPLLPYEDGKAAFIRTLEMARKCDAIVIASPPDSHEDYLRFYWHHCPILCEGPVTWIGPGNPHPHMTASNWLFVPQIRALKEKMEKPFSYKPVSCMLWFDYDLAKWRGPNWAYKESCYYNSGIDLINCHEAMTALYLFGPAEEATTYTRHTGKSLQADALASLIQHESGVLTTIHSGWHAAQYQRGIKITYEDGSIDEIGWASPGDDGICNKSYETMLDHWLKAIAENDCHVQPSLAQGYQAYKLMQGKLI